MNASCVTSSTSAASRTNRDNGRHDTPRHETTAVVHGRRDPMRKRGTPMVVEEPELRQDGYDDRPQGALVAIGHLDGNADARAANADALHALGADLRHPVAG